MSRARAVGAPVFLAAALTWLLLGTSGCATVKPWEREALAHRCIQWAPPGDAPALRQHVFSVREAAQGGHGSAGGGCGCD